MTTLNGIRVADPEYDDVSDEDLLKWLYTKHDEYNDMSQDDFNKSMGYTPPPPPPPPKPTGWAGDPSNPWNELKTFGNIGSGFADTALMGFSDEAYGGLAKLFGGDYEQARDAARKNLADSGVPGGVGQVLGAFASPFGKASLAKSIVQGGIYGLGSGEGSIENRLASGGIDAALAGLTHGAFSGLKSGIGYVADKVKGPLSVAAQTAEDEIKAAKKNLIEGLFARSNDDPSRIAAEAGKMVQQPRATSLFMPHELSQIQSAADSEAPLSARLASLLLGGPVRSRVAGNLTAAGMLAIPGYRDFVLSSPWLMAGVHGPVQGALSELPGKVGAFANKVVENAPRDTMIRLQRSVTGKTPQVLPSTDINPQGIINLLKAHAITQASNAPGRIATSQVQPYNNRLLNPQPMSNGYF